MDCRLALVKWQLNDSDPSGHFIRWARSTSLFSRPERPHT